MKVFIKLVFLFLLPQQGYCMLTSYKLSKDIECKEDIGARVSINLMWIDSEPRPSAYYIIPDKYLELFESSVSGWLSKTKKDTSVNFWFDGSKTTSAAIENTRQIIFKSLGEEISSRLHFRDILSLSTVNLNPETFSSPMPVYYVTDLLRFVIAKEILERSDATTFIYADLNVTPESESYIFDVETIKLLKKYGFVMLRNDMGSDCHPSGGTNGFENKFMLCVKDDDFINSITKVLIEPSHLIRNKISLFFAEEPLNLQQNLRQNVYQGIQQRIYDGILYMFLYLAHTKKILPEFELFYKHVPYSEREHYDPDLMIKFTPDKRLEWMPGFAVMNHPRVNDLHGEVSCIRDDTREFYKIDSRSAADLVVPCKRMGAPRSHFGL